VNSRGKLTGVGGFTLKPSGKYSTLRVQLPPFVAKALATLYQESGLLRGCPDLVIWNSTDETLRLVEVKCPHWDKPSRHQDEFMKVAASMGIPTSIAEWELSGSQR
jgi:VRR-NUC domain-containing protein